MEPKENQNFRIKEILVPLLILAAVLCVWFVKNNPQSQGSVSPAALTPDFELYAKEGFEVDGLFQHNLPVILDFGASWCGPCQLMKPVLEKMNEDLQGKVIIKYVDVDEFPALSAEYPITVVPTQFFFLADGTPYYPSADIPINFQVYNLASTGEHALTSHEGYLDEDGLLLILEEMGLDVQGGVAK